LAQQRILELDPDTPMLAMRMDTALASFRAMMEKAIADERGAAPSDATLGAATASGRC